MSSQHRDTIFCEEAIILEHHAHPEEQFILRLHAPKCAASAQPGSFAHITCAPDLPMRRPLSIMRVNRERGWVEFLYKIVGHGLASLSHRQPGEKISVLGPIGVPFQLTENRSRPLLIGGGVGIPPMIFLAETLKQNDQLNPLLLMGSEVPFPFALCDSQFEVDGIPSQVNQNIELIENWKIPGRLASLQGYSGCFNGYVTQLAECWLDRLSPGEVAKVKIFSCGPTPMLAAVADVAKKYGLPAQVSFEEHMACAVGGCAGCTVLIETDDGPAMKRVCVDGPVFDAYAAFPG